MSRVVIFGVGQIAEVAHFYLTHDSEHEVVAFTVDQAYIESETFHGLPVIPYEHLTDSYPPDQFQAFVPISYKQVNLLRKERYLDFKRRGYTLVSYISSRASYYGTPVGENCFIFENNVIQPFTRIGNNCILWSGNHIGHHTIIEDHCFLASHVVVSGSVVIGERSFLGVNATLRDNITLGQENVIGAGAVILKSTDDKAVYGATPTEKHALPSDRLRGI